MSTDARYPTTRPGKGLYESFYVRAVSPGEPLALWIRHTVHRAPGAAPQGSVWMTFFDGEAEAPVAHKETVGEDALAPHDGGLRIGDSLLAPGVVRGACGPGRWDLRFDMAEPELRHFPRAWMYEAPLPKTKLTSPMPAGDFGGTLSIGGRTVSLDGWRGMWGHNWGAQHAERWIWLHGVGFEGAPDAWLDVAIGRVKVAPGVVTPWVAQGALSLDGRRHAIGGPTRLRGVRIDERPASCTLTLPGEGVTLHGEVASPPGGTVGWVYADPDGGEHHSLHGSIARLELTVQRDGAPDRRLLSPHGACYELGLRERDHGVPIQPFGDG